jgi:ABC-type Na+ efflux pump permease subunit
VSRSRIRAIYRKDMRDALRDSRVLTAILLPLALGLLYSFIFSDENIRTQKAKVGVVSDGATRLTTVISQQTGRALRLTFVTMPNAARLEQQVRQKKVDVGLVVPPGFDAAVKAGESPLLTVVLPTSPSFDSDYVDAVLDRSVQFLAGRAPPARIALRSLPPESGGTTALEELGARKDFILVSIILLLAMIAVYAVPAVLVEETEKKTMQALTLIASTADVIAAKALFGMALSIVTVPVLLVITRGNPAEVGALAAAVVLSAAVLVGIGLLCAGLFKTQQQVNTWSGVILLALLAPAFTIGIPTPDAVNTALAFIPTAQTFRLLANAFAGRTLYPHEWLSYAVLLAWAVGAYGFVWWRLSRQEEW